MISQTKLNQRVDRIARPVTIYLSFLCTFWLVHYPLIWVGFRALNLNPGADPRFHQVVQVARTIADAPIWPIYHLPYWVSDSLFHHHVDYLWLRMLGAAILVCAGNETLGSPLVQIGRMGNCLRRLFGEPSE